MFYINVWLTVNESRDVSRVRDLLAQAADGSRSEEGCERFEVYQSESDAQRFLLIERWRTKADWEAHRSRQAFTEIYAPRVLPLVTREAHSCSLVSE